MKTMKYFGWILVAFLLVVSALAVLFIEDKGYVLINWQQTVVEMNLVALLLCVLVAFLLLYVLKWVLMVLLGVPIRRWLQKRRQVTVRENIKKGLLALNNGNSTKAHKLLQKAAAKAEIPSLVYALASDAAEAGGDHYQADALLEEAADDEDFINLAKYEHATHLVARGQYTQALSQLEGLKSKTMKGLLSSQLEWVYERLGKWPQLAKLMAERKEVSPEFAEIEADVWMNYLDHIAENAAGAEAVHQLHHAWGTAPERVKTEPVVISHYALLLAGLKDNETAYGEITEALKANWDDALVYAYGLVESQPQKQLDQVYQWIEQKPVSGALYLSAGRVAERAGDTNLAEQYYEQAIGLGEAEAAFELARVKQELKQPEASLEQLQTFFTLQSQ